MRKPAFNSSLLALLAGLGILLGPQESHAARLIDVTVVNRSTGERLTTYRHGGRLYVAGTPGDRYALELRSRSGERVLGVISVDGVNVLTGQTAAPLQSGYVLDGRQTYAIAGWRKSMDDVAQFVFTAVADSYAARTGRPDNVGVIGVAVFREKPSPVMPSPAPSVGAAAENDRATDAGQPASPAPLAKQQSASGTLADRRAERALAEPRQRLGTGHGEREHSPTRQTEFERAGEAPDEVVTLYYDSRANLVARGIIPAPRLAEPNPFPGRNGFVPDPRG